jgi:hypothetical protein
MIRIVQADADQLTNAADAGPQSRVAVNLRKRRRIERLQLRQARRAEFGARDVVDDAGQVADVAVVVQQARLFAAGFAITQ